MSEKIFDKVKPGVATGEAVSEIFRIAKANRFAIPAVNVVGTDSVNAVLEAAKTVNSPVIIQFSTAGFEQSETSSPLRPELKTSVFLSLTCEHLLI